MNNISKYCKTCLNELNSQEFDASGRGAFGLRTDCRACSSKVLGQKRQRSEEEYRCASCFSMQKAIYFKIHAGRREEICRVCSTGNIAVRRKNFKRPSEKQVQNLGNFGGNFKKIKSSIEDFFSEYEYTFPRDGYWLDIYLNLYDDITKALRNIVTRNVSINFSILVDFTMQKKNGDEFKVQREGTSLKVGKNLDTVAIKNNIYGVFDKIFNTNYDESSLSLFTIDRVRIQAYPSIIMTGGSYQKLPQKLVNSRSCVNIKNKDKKCFLWSVIANFHRKENGNVSLVSSYRDYIKNFEHSFLRYPVSVSDIMNFEQKNNLTINLYIINEDEEQLRYIDLIYPSACRTINESRHVNLLLYKEHYVLIKDVNKLFSKTVKGKHKAFVCQQCGTASFTSLDALGNHKITCINSQVPVYTIPRDKMYVKFENYGNKFEVPFTIYADFESFFENNDKIKDTKCVEFLKCHKPLAFAFKTVSRFDSTCDNYVQYIGPEADKEFAKMLGQECKRIYELIKNIKPLVMTCEEVQSFESSTLCFLCFKPFVAKDKNLQKVRDHNHFTGKYRGPAHSSCNIRYTKKSYTVPVIFHNLEGYDLHLFVKQLYLCGDKFTLIPKSREKYLSLGLKIKETLVKVKFIDSLHFFGGSLSDNASRLAKEDFKFIDSKDEVLKSKQYFPYDYITGLHVLDLELPRDLNNWYNMLTDSTITKEQLKHSHMVYETYQCKNLRDYTMLYLKVDVLLLAEVFEKFRSVALKTYSLDPCHYYTTPGLAWDAALKMSDVQLEVLKDESIVDFFIEKGTMKGGISTVCRKKEATANNKYMTSFDSTKESNYLMYFDVTNLYGYAMTFPLPTGNFQMHKEITLEELDMLLESDKDIGAILEVDLIYPTSLKDQHIELPLAPEHLDGKLSPNLFSKYNYRLRYENLKYYASKGLILQKIHCAITFSQKPWLQEYILKNTESRKLTSDESEKNFYKLMNNAVYGKTLENVFNRRNFKIVTNLEEVTRTINKEKMLKQYILNENMTLLELEKKKVEFDRPIYVGFTILELSKLHMYKLHYDAVKGNFHDNATLMYMDTDSLVYDIKTQDVYEDLQHLAPILDLSVYPQSFKLHDKSNKGTLGTLKDEFACRDGKLNMITEFNCLRSKSYSLVDLYEKETKKCKGVTKTALRDISNSDYSKCAQTGNAVSVKQKTFKSIDHEIYTIELKKEALSRFDDKRQIDARFSSIGAEGQSYYTHTVPWGYSKTCDIE